MADINDNLNARIVNEPMATVIVLNIGMKSGLVTVNITLLIRSNVALTKSKIVKKLGHTIEPINLNIVQKIVINVVLIVVNIMQNIARNV